MNTVPLSGPSVVSAAIEPIPRLALGRCQPLQPVLDVHRVVALLANQFRHQLGQRCPGPADECLEPDRVGRLVQVAAGHRHRPVAAAVVQEARVPVVGGFAVVGDGIGVRAGQLAQQAVERRRVAQLVLGQRTHRDVLFELRRDPRPLRIGEPDDELVIGHREEEGAKFGRGHGHRAGAGRPGGAACNIHFERALGFGWPAWARAAASLSRIT